MEKATELWLVRHGQTDWNLEGRYQGQSDIPLNQTGIEQARELSLSLREYPFGALYASDLSRARMTAEILGERFHLAVQTDPRLREINQGEWEGYLVSEIRARFQDLATAERRKIYMNPPGGESVSAVAGRVAAAVNEIARRHPGEKVLVVSHGLAVATLICQADDISLDVVYKHIPDNAQPTRINWIFIGSRTAA